jgi:transposase
MVWGTNSGALPRQDKIAPLVADLGRWLRGVRRKMSRADVAKAIDYMLKRWAAFSRFLRVPVERER